MLMLDIFVFCSKALNLADYPEDVFRKKLKVIIGFEIKIEEWTACFRLNQNRTPKERKNIKNHRTTKN